MTERETEQKWHLIDGGGEDDRYDVKAARWPGTVHHHGGFFNGVVVPASSVEQLEQAIIAEKQHSDELTVRLEQLEQEVERLRAAQPELERLLPAERIALTAARGQLGRGVNPGINTTAVLALALDRLFALSSSTPESEKADD